MARKKKTEEQMQLFESGGTPSQTDKADKAFSEMDDLLKKGISEEVKKEDGKVISRTYKNPSYAAEDVLRMLREGKISVEQAEKFLQEQKEAGNYAKGGMEDGGLKDEGGSVDPVSGNDVPSGSTQAEVRDDIPAQLSEGEFVFPADVVRYIGLENLMQLRSKAKQGLAKMEAMGQMGNSEDATMSDDVEFESEIDALIENFDPNDPSTMEFSQGGVVKAANGYFAQPQQSSYGYMPPGFGTQQQVPASGLSYRAPQIPTAQSFVTSAGQRAGSSVGTDTGMQDNIEQRQYIGPNGELITIMFKNGVPQQKIPDGYKVYKPEEEVTPKVTQPEVTSPGSSGDDREREEAEAGRVAQERELNNLLAKHDPAFAKVIAEDPFMTGKLANPYTTLMATVNTLGARTDTIPGVLEKFGIPVADFEVPGVFGKIPGNKYDVGKLANTIRTADLLVDQFGIDEDKIGDIISYTNLDTDGDGRVTKDDLVDKSGNFTKAGQDLFMDIDGEDVSKSDPATSRSTPSSTPTDYESEAAGVGSSRGTDRSGGSVAGSGSFADAARSGTYDDSGYDDSPSGTNVSDYSSSQPGGGYESGSHSTSDMGGDYSKGGLAEQTQRALKSSRKKK
jgi:hypothetical protein